MALDIAMALFAGISAVAEAIQAWQSTRDRRKAARVFDETYDKTLHAPESKKAAEQLVAIIPPEVIKDLEGRADACWTGYRKVLGGEFLPDEVDKATDSVQACVCRELWRIHKLNGCIPDRWNGQWQRYKCVERQGPVSA
jgi:hypothetical protein